MDYSRPHMQNQKLGNYSDIELKALKAKGNELLAKIERQQGRIKGIGATGNRLGVSNSLGVTRTQSERRRGVDQGSLTFNGITQKQNVVQRA